MAIRGCIEIRFGSVRERDDKRFPILRALFGNLGYEKPDRFEGGGGVLA